MPRYARELLKLSAAVGCLLLLGYFLFVPSKKPKLVPLRMTAGDATGLRHKLALELANEAARVGMKIDVQPTTGSEAAIQGLTKGDFDLAFVQGGLATDSLTNPRQLTAMHIEPLHLLVKAEVFAKIKASGLGELAGCSVNLGPVGSGTQILANELMKFAGLSALDSKGDSKANSYRATSLNYRELMERATEDLPDAVFTVSSLPSPLADFMIDYRGYRLVPLPFGEAMAIEAFLQLGDPLDPNAIDKRHLFEAGIPAFTYSVNRSEPPEPIETIGTRLLLIANERVPNEVVQRLLDAVYSSDFALAERPPLDASLLDLPPEFRLHEGSVQYRQRNKPLIAGDAIDYTEKLLAIFAVLAAGVLFLVNWFYSRRQRKRESRFASYMDRVIAIENASMKTEFAAQLDLAELIRLQRELAELKSDAVRKFANGELEGEGLIHAFLAVVNDARNQLTRLILHQRDNIEDQAAQQHLDANALWNSQANSESKPETV